MFVRFRQTQSRLQVSIVETRRADGKVRHEHIASLGSVRIPPDVADRVAFWQRLHERLARLSNRVDAAMQGKILGDIHARIPMVTVEEQRDYDEVMRQLEERQPRHPRVQRRFERHCIRLAQLREAVGEETFMGLLRTIYCSEIDRTERNVIRQLHRAFVSER